MKLYLAVNKDGSEHCFVQKPQRDEWLCNKRKLPFNQWNKLTPENSSFWSMKGVMDGKATLKSGSIEQITGKSLTWYDSPVEVDVEITKYLMS